MNVEQQQQSQQWCQRIWRVVEAIPIGRVASYGQIAKLAGMARGARRVGKALNLAPENLQLPWQRVITASGRIAFPRQSPAYLRQRDLLRAEGVVVQAGKVDMRRFAWQPSLDELLWRID